MIIKSLEDQAYTLKQMLDVGFMRIFGKEVKSSIEIGGDAAVNVGSYGVLISPTLISPKKSGWRYDVGVEIVYPGNREEPPGSDFDDIWSKNFENVQEGDIAEVVKVIFDLEYKQRLNNYMSDEEAYQQSLDAEAEHACLSENSIPESKMLDAECADKEEFDELDDAEDFDNSLPF